MAGTELSIVQPLRASRLGHSNTGGGDPGSPEGQACAARDDGRPSYAGTAARGNGRLQAANPVVQFPAIHRCGGRRRGIRSITRLGDGSLAHRRFASGPER